MKDNNTTATPEAWKMRFLANGTSGTWFYTDVTGSFKPSGLFPLALQK